MTTTQFPFYSGLWNGFFNRAFYANVASSWRGRGFAYMALIVVLTLFPASYMMAGGLRQFLATEFDYIVPQLPEMRAVSGKLTSEAEQPVFLNGSDGKPIGVIDLTRKQFTIPQDAKVKFLISEDMLVVALSDADYIPFSLMFLPEGRVIDGAYLESLRTVANSPAIWLFVVIAMFFTWLIRLAIALFYAWIGQLFSRNKALNVEIGFGGLYQIGLVAEGTSLLLSTLLTVLLLAIGIFPPGSVGGVLIAVFYMWFGIKATRDWVAGALPPLKERF